MKSWLLSLLVVLLIVLGGFFLWRKGYLKNVKLPSKIQKNSTFQTVSPTEKKEEETLKKEEKNLSPIDQETLKGTDVDFSDIDQELKAIESDLKKL